MSNSWYAKNRRLSRGDRGQDVGRLQRELNAAGANPELAVTGVFDQQTEKAVREFQGRVDLIQDGFVGPITHAVLFESNFQYSPVRPPVVNQGTIDLCWAASLESVLRGPWPGRRRWRTATLRANYSRFLTPRGAISERGLIAAGRDLAFRDITPRLSNRKRLFAEVLTKLLTAKRPLLLVDNSTGSVAHTPVLYGVKIRRGEIRLMLMDPLSGHTEALLDDIQPSAIRLSILAANEVHVRP